MKTIKQYQDIIKQSIAKLKLAAGNDPFLSQADLDKFLSKINEGDRGLFTSLIQLSFSKEQKKNPDGRITVRDLDSIEQYALEKILSHFPVHPGTLTGDFSQKLEAQGKADRQFADELKLFAETARNIPDHILLSQLKDLTEGLSFGTYASGGQSAVEVFDRHMSGL